MTDNKLKFENLIDEDLKSTHFVEANYPNQFPEQMPIYLMIDLDESPPAVYVDTYNFSLTGTPCDIWHKRRLSFELPPNVDASELHDWVNDFLADDINTLIEDIEIEWDGSNFVGNFGDAALTIYDNWKSYYLNDHAPTHNGGLYSPCEYLQDVTRYPDDGYPTATVAGFTITKDTTDDEISKFAETLTSDAIYDDIVFTGTIEGFLTDLRDDCETYSE